MVTPERGTWPGAAPRAVGGSERGAPERPHETFPARGDRAERCRAADRIARYAAAARSVSADLLMAVMRVESDFRPAIRSRAGAVGMMQIMPSTGSGMSCGSLDDPLENVDCGARLLRRLLNRYDGNEVYVLGAYNGGSGYIRSAVRARRVPPNLGYVERVLLARTRYRRGGCRALLRSFRR